MDSGRIPDYVLKDEKLVAQLPVFFRTISGQKPSREDLAKLVELIRASAGERAQIGRTLIVNAGPKGTVVEIVPDK